MIFTLLTSLIIAWGAIACIYMLRRAWTRFPRRDLDDIVHFLYPVDLELAQALLDPALEFESSWKLSRQEFRRVQRRRMRLYLEIVRRMSHNSKVLVEFGNAEIHRGDADSVEMARTLEQRAVEVRLYAVLTLWKLRFWMWASPSDLIRRPIPRPKMGSLRRAGDLDGIQTYDALKSAAAAAFAHRQPGELDTLTRNL